MNAVSLYRKYDMPTLVEMLRLVSELPESQLRNGSIYLLTPKARKKTDAIARAISWHMEDNAALTAKPGAEGEK